MTFTLQQALKTQQALREAANLPDEQFPLPAFVGMISDEIETLRTKGKTDQEITELINKAAGTNLSSSAVTENYAPPEDRQRG